MPNLRIYYFQAGGAEFLDLLRKSQVQFKELVPPLGQIRASGGTVEVLSATVPILGLLRLCFSHGYGREGQGQRSSA